MFMPRKFEITYTIDVPGRPPAVFPIRLNESGLLADPPVAKPDWASRAHLDCRDCSCCSDYCLAALAVAPVVEYFHDLTSLQPVTAIAEQGGRVYRMQCPAPRALASVMGLLLAASGCSKTLAFRAMAMYHLPFSTAEETVTRAAGFWLLRRWADHSLETEDPFADLIEAWAGLEEVNRHLARRLQGPCPTDAAPNGVAFLDALAKLCMMGFDTQLEALKPAFQALEAPPSAESLGEVG